MRIFCKNFGVILAPDCDAHNGANGLVIVVSCDCNDVTRQLIQSAVFLALFSITATENIYDIRAKPK